MPLFIVGDRLPMDMTPEAVRYSLETIWEIADLPEDLLDELNIVYTAGVPQWPDGKCIGVYMAPPEAVEALTSDAGSHTDWLDASQTFPIETVVPEPIPIILKRDADRLRFAQLVNCMRVSINVDLLAVTYLMLSRWEETVVTSRDAHDRFPAKASIAYRQGFLDRPVVDEYAAILRQWVQCLYPSIPPARLGQTMIPTTLTICQCTRAEHGPSKEQRAA